MYSVCIPDTAASFFPVVAVRYRAHRTSCRTRGPWFRPVFLIDAYCGFPQCPLANVGAVPVIRPRPAPYISVYLQFIQLDWR
jgi:hypothetical protein